MQKETLRDLRVQNKKTAEQVAAELKIARSTYSNYEQGIRTIDIRFIIPLAKIYDCTEREIIEAQLNSCPSVRLNSRQGRQRNHKE